MSKITVELQCEKLEWPKGPLDIVDEAVKTVIEKNSERLGCRVLIQYFESYNFDIKIIDEFFQKVEPEDIYYLSLILCVVTVTGPKSFFTQKHVEWIWNMESRKTWIDKAIRYSMKVHGERKTARLFSGLSEPE